MADGARDLPTAAFGACGSCEVDFVEAQVTTEHAYRYGITVPLNAPLSEHPRLVRELAAAGYTDVWSAEVDGLDGFTPLTVAATADSSVRLGTAIVSPYTRGPATLAMTATALAELAPGRFHLGIGAASPI